MIDGGGESCHFTEFTEFVILVQQLFGLFFFRNPLILFPALLISAWLFFQTIVSYKLDELRPKLIAVKFQHLDSVLVADAEVRLKRRMLLDISLKLRVEVFQVIAFLSWRT